MDKEKQYDFLLSNELLQSQILTQILGLVGGGVTLNHLEAFGLSRDAKDLLGKKFDERDGEGTY